MHSGCIDTGQEGVNVWAIKGLTVCGVCFIMFAACCFYLGDMLFCIPLLCREKAACPSWQERDLSCLHTGLSRQLCMTITQCRRGS
ncbi:unnamed protein product, partial [Staurois parvus]